MKNYYGLIGSYANSSDEGIYSFLIKEDKLCDIKLKAAINNPTYLCNSSKLFSIISKEDKGGVALLNLTSKDTIIKDLDLSLGKQPCHIAIDSKRKRLFSANYHTGEINYYSFTDNSISLIDKLTGNESSKMHFVSPIPKTNKGIAIDLGNDEIIIFDYDYNIAKIPSLSIKLKENCGPRHLVFHPSMKYLFVLTEMSSEIVTIKIEPDLTLKVISYTSTLPCDFSLESFGGAIRISKDGNYIFASNRGHNSISVFKFNTDDGSLKLLNNYSTYGNHPRDFNLTPDDKYLLISNTFSNNLCLYKHDLKGNLTLLQTNISINKPTCILFL